MEKRPRTKRIRFAYTTPVTWDKNRFTGSWSQDTTTPKIQFHQHQKHFWCSKDSIYRIRRVKNWDYEENGPLMMPFLGFWHENGPGIMQTRLLNIQWLKFFEIFAFWIFWIISSSGNKCNKMYVTDVGNNERGVTEFVTILSHWIYLEDFEKKKWGKARIFHPVKHFLRLVRFFVESSVSHISHGSLKVTVILRNTDDVIPNTAQLFVLWKNKLLDKVFYVAGNFDSFITAKKEISFRKIVEK